MGVRKLSIALDAKVAAGASASAERRGLSLSAWLNTAAERELAIEDGLLAVTEWEAEHGPLTADELRAAEDILAGRFRKKLPPSTGRAAPARAKRR